MTKCINLLLLGLFLAFSPMKLLANVSESYVVKKSDTLSKISKKYKTTPQALASLNGISTTSVIQIGQKLKVPATYKKHVVRSGETLGAIASKHNVQTSVLVSYNGMKNPNSLSVGQELRVPLGGSTSAAFTPVKYNHAKLPGSMTRSLARVSVRSGRWKYIIVHHSATPQGSAVGIDRYHRDERHMVNGLAYHFVIGNGKGMKDGEIHLGNRWVKQLQGGHMASWALNNKCVGVCLIGNFETQRPTKKQLDSLEAICRYLMNRNRLSYDKVRSHGNVNSKPTACPGKNMNVASFRNRLKAK